MSNRASLERLKFCNFKLKTLLNITRAINHNLEVNELLNTYKALLRDELNIGKVIIYGFTNSGWNVILKSGIENKDYEEIDVERDLLHLYEINITLSIPNPILRAFDFIIPILHNSKALAYVLLGDFEEEREGISPTIKHLHFIQTLTNIIMVAIENKRLIAENMQQERLKKELEMATKMQEMLIPAADIFEKSEHIAVQPFYLPHFEVGGDYYDFDILSESEMFFCIADVSGKGMPAAMLMSNFQASLKALFTSGVELAALVQKLNSIVIKNANGDRFITVFLGKYNHVTHKLQYINAGHNPPVFYSPSLPDIQFLTQGCMGIGMIDQIPFISVGELEITENSKILCFTDGLAELEKDGMPEYGQTALEQCVKNDNHIVQTIENLLAILDVNKSNPSLFDDITLLGIEFFIPPLKV